MRYVDSGVSEVVGVLLMLTITLILLSVAAVAMNGTMDQTTQPISATITSQGLKNDTVIFENIAGDSFVLSQIEVRFGIRERPTEYITLRNEGSEDILETRSGENSVGLGDRFYVKPEQIYSNGTIAWGSFMVSAGEHMTYRFFDRRTGVPIASGEISIS